MKKILLFALAVLLSVSLLGCKGSDNGNPLRLEVQAQDVQQQTNESDEEMVKALIADFGRRLQRVSLLAPQDLLKKSMEENYGDFVSQELLNEWINDPLNAPGRLTSSPWPDRIEIVTLQRLSENAYEVKGEIIEVTSTEKEKNGVSAKRPIALVIEKINDHWRICKVTLSPYEETNSTSYENTQYGFSFSLPESWKNYTILTDKWEGLAQENSGSEKIMETGPMIRIRHPLWANEKPRQDIPIMIFTQDQWKALQQEKFHIGAAPIGPKELGHNAKYVFALPARYNFAFPTGYEEVEDILNNNPLQSIDENN